MKRDFKRRRSFGRGIDISLHFLSRAIATDVVDALSSPHSINDKGKIICILNRKASKENPSILQHIFFKKLLIFPNFREEFATRNLSIFGLHHERQFFLVDKTSL